MKPIELLEQELEKYVKDRDKSIKSFEKGEIDEATHDQHINNLTPIIEEYKYIIRIVKYNTE
jgi:hypothetical protein